MFDGDQGLAQTLLLASHTVIGVGATIVAAHGLVGTITLDGVARAAGIQLFHQAHSVEETLLFTFL